MTTPTAPRYCVHDSPVGGILIVASDAGLVGVHPVHGALTSELEAVARRVGAYPTPDDADPLMHETARQLDEYFAGERRAFDLPLDWVGVARFTGTALRAVCDIPYGETAGYGEVAIAAGSPRAARAVGTACATTPFSIVVPVHRVVRADGSLGEYGGHPEVKRLLVDLERSHSAAPEDGAAEPGV